ncbi:DUF4175 family protein [Mucilaginibacter sp. KACC 22063]|uniref:DUF4175 family protein n=1 Tax=Mucilaginibacter sp. KACC 22063 TaxID=3025666 RepID=UPI002365B85D|nr:DUF4175 family protein [Mucilaginibacter sp. KACC 22063]WDF54591.1 DUF4175 family protein [Mucilaginibacter sp. KACC 22063]
MAEQQGIHKIKSLQQRWIGYQVAADALFALAVALIAGSILHFVGNASALWAILIFVALFIAISSIRRPWQVTSQSVINFLNQTYPELQESSDLVTKPTGSLNLLEQLQLSKVESALQQVPSTPSQFSKRLKAAVIWILAALVLSFIITRLPQSFNHSLTNLVKGNSAVNAKHLPPEKILPAISAAELTITPPAYTRKSPRKQDRFTLDVEEGAFVSWNIKTNIDVKKVTLIFNEHESLAMRPSGSHSKWQVQKTISKPGFYQVNIDGKLSDLYPVQVIKDAPPVIKIKTPKQYTHIDAGEKPMINVTVSLTDDYGIENAIINATVAKGQGEAVKFKEYKINFNESFATHSKQYEVKKQIDLPSLKMEPGDELYFYVSANDTHNQPSRTDVYIVSIQDTAQLLSMDGIVSAANVKPEFFRSERQIIIDSQKLLHDRDSISKEEFNRRSNELGSDQKLLRLRYGKFLGEEDESDIGESKNDELGKAENFGNAAMVMDAYTDKHDNAEDATFLEPTVKAQLKATLTEMWKAELHLRMYKPEDALPFEYKALRLLKDLQQKSRSYVAKTGYNPPPLKMEKRLSGDLTKITETVNKQDVKRPDDQFINLKKAVVILEQLKTDSKLATADQHILQLAGQQLSAKASAQPNAYLPAVAALRKIIEKGGNAGDKNISLVEKAIQRALPQNKPMPSPSTSADIGLAQSYFKNLNRSNR